MADDAPESAALTVSEAAKRLGVSERTCRKRLESGRIQGRRIHKGLRVVWQVDGMALRKQGPETAALAEVIGPDAGTAEGRKALEALLALAPVPGQLERLTAVVEALAARIPMPPAPSPVEPRRPWWRRLIGL